MSKNYISGELKEKFVKPLEEVAYHKHCYARDVFRDWIASSALAASGYLMVRAGEVEIGKSRIDRADAILSGYGEKDIQTMLELSGTLRKELQEDPRDLLGELYMKLQVNNSSLGQIFTPFCVSELMSSILNTGEDDNDSLDISDCCCGSGSMLIAHHKNVLTKGYDASYYNCIAQDIDEFCCMMAYLQMELLGMSALVYNDDSLARPFGPNREICKMYVTTQYFINDYNAREKESKSA